MEWFSAVTAIRATWSEYIVVHYSDTLLEAQRRSVVRLFLQDDPSRLPTEQIQNALMEQVMVLRCSS